MINKVTFLISSLSGGGAEGLCVNIANGLASRGWDISLIVLNTKKSVFHNRINKKVNFKILGISNTRYSFKALYQFIKNEEPLKLVVFNYELTVMMYFVRLLSFKKFILISRNINTISKKKENLKGIWIKYFVFPIIDFFYKKSDHIINQCKSMQNDIVRHYNLDQKKTSVIYNPVNEIIEKHNQRNEIELNKEGYLLCVGRLESQKALNYSITAFSNVLKIFPNLRLKILGEGSLRNELIKLTIDLGIKNKVDFVGFDSDIIKYFSKAEATILSSLYEGFPNVLIESIALGTPVVSFDCKSGPSEIIENGINGYLAKYLDVNDLEAKILLTLNKRWNYKLIAESAHRFRLDSALNRWENLLTKKFN